MVPEIFYPLYIAIKPNDELHFRIYVTLRSAEISFKMLKRLLDSASQHLTWRSEDRSENRYSDEIETIKANLNRHEGEYIKNSFCITSSSINI